MTRATSYGDNRPLRGEQGFAGYGVGTYYMHKPAPLESNATGKLHLAYKSLEPRFRSMLQSEMMPGKPYVYES